MKLLAVLAFLATPALADVYRCDAGRKTVYQDQPCPNAKVIDNINALPPPRQEQVRAMDRASRERAYVDQRARAREAEEERSKAARQTIDAKPAKSRADRADKHSGRSDRYYDRPDRYYDRPDRYYDRSASRYSGSGNADGGRTPLPVR